MGSPLGLPDRRTDSPEVDSARVSVDSGLGQTRIGLNGDYCDVRNREPRKALSIIRNGRDIMLHVHRSTGQGDTLSRLYRSKMERNINACNNNSEPEEEYIEVDAVDDENDRNRRLASANDSLNRKKQSPGLIDMQANAGNHVIAKISKGAKSEQTSARNHSKLEISHRVERMLHDSPPEKMIRQNTPDTLKPPRDYNARVIQRQCRPTPPDGTTPHTRDLHPQLSPEQVPRYPEFLINSDRLPFVSPLGSPTYDLKDIKSWPVGPGRPGFSSGFLPFGYAGLQQPFLDIASRGNYFTPNRTDILSISPRRGPPLKSAFHAMKSQMTSFGMSELSAHVLSRAPLFPFPPGLLPFPTVRHEPMSLTSRSGLNLQPPRQKLIKPASPPTFPTTPPVSPDHKSGSLPWLLTPTYAPGNLKTSSGAHTGKISKRHSDPPRYQCDACKKSYATFSGLSKHKQFHCETQIKKEFTCKYCDKTYTSLGALKMHIRTHTLPCKCQICGKAFSRPWLLQGHVRTHTGEKPFQCPHCGRSFADRSNLRAHLQTHSDVKKYSCKNCSKTFSRMSLLVKHEEGSCPGLKTTAIPLVI